VSPVTWSEAARQALYGLGGFYHRPEGPAGHFRTSVHATGLFADAVLSLLYDIDGALGRPARLDLVDVGAGRGELLLAVHARVSAGAAADGLAGRLRLHAVERAVVPSGRVPPDLSWSADLPEDVVGLVVANELLDDVPVDVVEVGPDGPRRVLVEPATGAESPGGPVGLRDAGWLVRWWPLRDAALGDRAEVGLARDELWANVVGSLDRGVAVAVDYGHLAADRAAGRYTAGTLAGYRDGRQVPPVPDGSCDITSHVAMDACAAAGESAGADETVLLTQRAALRALAVSGRLPDVALASTDPSRYAADLQAAGAEAELLAPHGLGGFWWLVQAVGTTVPAPLRAAAVHPD
jgi:SAM-dependent MidA family methyltransferase